MIPVLFAVSAITFTIMHLTPGGPFDRERKIPDAVRENIEKKYGLDKPLVVQYLDYMGGAVRGDLGPSFRNSRMTVTEIIISGLPVTAQLALAALVVGIVIGVPLGILAALRQNTVIDYLGVAFSVGGYSVPNFVLAIVLILVFSVMLHALPSNNWGTLAHMVMPTIALATGPAALLARYTRSSILDVKRQDYVRTARSKGLTEQLVVLRHMLPNALIPVVTVLGPLAAALITGSFIIETMFAFPGWGRQYVTAISQRDYSMIMATTLIFALLIQLANISVDFVYTLIDPRIKLS